MREDSFKIILEALAEQIDRLRGEAYIRGLEIERLKEEKAELIRQRDALCRKETDNA